MIMLRIMHLILNITLCYFFLLQCIKYDAGEIAIFEIYIQEIKIKKNSK